MADLVSEVPATVLAVYAHPDDPDVSCGGSLARWAAGGSSVHVCICANGEKGSDDPAVRAEDLVARRRLETAASGEVLGVLAQHWLGYPDGELSDDPSLVGRLVALIRTVRPDVVVGADPTAVFFGQHYFNHRDHRAVGWALLDAASPAAANPHYFPEAGPAHRVGTVYLSGTLEPDIWVDITTTIEAKARAVACHASQVGDSDEWLRSVVRQRAEAAGKQAGVRYAEGFRRLLLGP
jgi:LmbE family N-acetylglucosaminyl deacetylase